MVVAPVLWDSFAHKNPTGPAYFAPQTRATYTRGRKEQATKKGRDDEQLGVTHYHEAESPGVPQVEHRNLQTADYLVVPKGTSHKDAAMQLIAYCVSGENNDRLSEFIEYAPVNKESISKVDPQVSPQLPTAHRAVSVTYNTRNGRITTGKRS